jgi:hypothetical protein
MKKEELIDKYERKYETIYGSPVIQLNQILEDLKQLDGPQKLAVPQFVADWYEENKDDFEGNLFRFAHNIPSTFDGAKLNEFERWFLNASTKAFQTLVNMHQFGYEVEREERYYIRLKNVDENYNYLTCIKHLHAWALTEIKRDKKFRTEHTRKELEEAGFGEVFDSPLFEVEEVENE